MLQYCFFTYYPQSSINHSFIDLSLCCRFFLLHNMLPFMSQPVCLQFLLCCIFGMCFVFFTQFCAFQIRVVNAFRMGLDTRYDSHSLTSVRSIHSLQSAKFQKQHSGQQPHQPTSPLASPDISHNPETTTNL